MFSVALAIFCGLSIYLALEKDEKNKRSYRRSKQITSYRNLNKSILLYYTAKW